MAEAGGKPPRKPQKPEKVAARSASARRASQVATANIADTANRRVRLILKTYVAASKRMLESKISEAGRFDLRVPPRELNIEIGKMLEREQIACVHDGSNTLPDIFALPEAAKADVNRRIARINELYGIFNRYAGDEGEIGSAGEEMIRRIFQQSLEYDIICPRWGDVAAYKGIALEQQSDGIVMATLPLEGRPANDAVALVEVKNRREWLYPQDYRLWKLIRNAYKLDVVGMFFARRISETTFGYTLKKVGALGIEMFGQFAPQQLAAELGPVKDKRGLGFHDLYFNPETPGYLQRRVDSIAPRILVARDRMTKVRDIVEPYLDELADNSVKGEKRSSLFDELSLELKEFDYPSTREEEDEDEESWEDVNPRDQEDPWADEDWRGF